MSVEAELKAVVWDADSVRAALAERASAEKSTDADRYFDYPDNRLSKQGRELRVRTVTQDDGGTRVLLTYKEPAVDIAFEKQCANYRFTAQGRNLLATLVTVPELEGQTFIELETMANDDEVEAALAVVRTALSELGTDGDDLTTEAYTDAVAARRG